MCPQAVGLVQKECEEVGISCSVISILDEINMQLKVPRYFSVPFPMGFPLGEPDNFDIQKKICTEALKLIQ